MVVVAVVVVDTFLATIDFDIVVILWPSLTVFAVFVAVDLDVVGRIAVFLAVLTLGNVDLLVASVDFDVYSRVFVSTVVISMSVQRSVLFIRWMAKITRLTGPVRFRPYPRDLGDDLRDIYPLLRRRYNCRSGADGVHDPLRRR